MKLLAVLFFSNVWACLTTQMEVNGVCADCSSIFGSCLQCSQHLNSYQCDQCSDGLYLLRTENDSGVYSFCVNDCAEFAYNYVNNPNTMQCEFCGEGCYQCSAQKGCLANYKVNHGQKFSQTYSTGGLFSAAQPSSIFTLATPCKDSRCDICAKYDKVIGNSTYNVCDSCYMYVNNYPISKQAVLNCALCDPYMISNCNTCDPDRPQQCASCNSGYWLNVTNVLSNALIYQSTKCIACNLSPGCNRCNSTNHCLECDPGYQLTSSGTCQACDLAAFNSAYTYFPTRCTICTSSSPTTCQYCDIGFLGSYSNPDSCELKCDINQYPNVTYAIVNSNENVIQSTTCQACDLSCESCIGAGAYNCTSCALNTQYLAILNITTQAGQCLNRVTGSATFDIFVTPIVPANAMMLLNQTTIGSLFNPFWDIDYALTRAQELAVQYISAVKVNIYLFKGDHYVIRDKGDTQLVYQHVQFQSKGNLNYDLTIQPLPCDYVGSLGINLADVCTADQVTIYNKNRELFVINVPQSLVVSKIKIDSLDSILPEGSTCLRLRKQCCQIVDDLVSSLNSGGECESALRAFLQSNEAKCLVNSPRSLFKMQLNNMQEVTEPNTLKLSQVSVTNFYYAMNSIIGFTPIWGNVDIDDSEFSQLKICGSVIKNQFYESKPDVLGSINHALISESERQDIQTVLPDYNSNPASQVCTTDCFQITATSVSVTKVPYQTNEITSNTLVAQENGMRYQGYFMFLNSFQGPVTLTGSTFNNNKMAYSTCEPLTPSVEFSLNNFQQLHNPQASFDKIQQGQLITILNHSDNIVLRSNSFEGNVMTSGLMSIESSGTTLVESNTFSSNSAVFGNNIMTVRQCKGATISANTFNKNAGCSGTSLLTLQCPSDSFSYDSTLDEYSLIEDKQPPADTSVTMDQNSYVGNLVGKDKSLVTIEGFNSVTLAAEYYSQNQNYLPQTFKALSRITLSTPPANIDTLFDYAYKAQSILKLACATTLNLSQVSFDNNWVADHQSFTNEYQSNALLLQDIIGTLIATELTFTNNKGVAGTATLPSEQAGFQSGLMVFKNCQITKFEFDQAIFAENTVLMNMTQSGYVVPTLLYLTQDQITAYTTITGLVVTQNTIINTDAIIINLRQATFNQLTVTYNTGQNIIVFDLPTDVAADQYIVKSSSVISNNIVTDGAVIVIREAQNIEFSNKDSATDSTVPSTSKVYFNSVTFSSNLMTGELGSTSCVNVIKTKARTYPWMSLKFDACKFSGNSGTKTSAINIADSMTAWFVMSNSQFSVTSTTNYNRIAQVIYQDNNDSYMQIDSNVFNCQESYDSTKIMFYTGAQGRPSLFRINDFNTPTERLSKLQLNNTEDNGTLDPDSFKNNFTSNVYSGCNQVDRGSVFYLEKGARLQDTASSYSGLSAIEGGVAYIDGDGTYLTIKQAKLVKTIYAYYGAIVYVINGATAEITTQITIQSPIIAYEGTVAYLTQRGRLLMTNQITVRQAVANKAAIILAINGAQFWIDGVTFTKCSATYQSAIISIENGREQFHLVNGETQLSYGQDFKQWSYINDTTITLSLVPELGRLVSVTNGALFVNSTDFTDNQQANLDNAGITIFSSELQVYNCVFSSKSKEIVNFIYQKNLKEITGTYIAAYDISDVIIESTTFQIARGSQGGCVAIVGGSKVQIKHSSFAFCAAMIGGAVYASAFEQILIQNTTFANNVAYQGYGQNVYAIGGTGSLELFDCNLQSYQNSVFVSATSITITSTAFSIGAMPISNNVLSNGGGLFIDFALQVVIKNSSFTNLKAERGGAIYFLQNPDNTQNALASRYRLDSKLIITGTKFINCSASVNGGAIFLENTKQGVISFSNFTSISAAQNGGAIYFFCTPKSVLEQQTQSTNCQLALNTLLFIKTKAQNGGAVFWNFAEPIVTTSQPTENSELLVQSKNLEWSYKSLRFLNCSASGYGPQIAGAVQELVQITNMTYQQYYNQQSPRRQDILRQYDRLNITANNSLLHEIVYSDVQSGGNVPATWFALIDKYGQVVQSNSGSQIKFGLEAKQAQVSSIFATFIEGTQDFYSTFGVFEMEHMGVVSAPDIHIHASLIVNAVDIRVPTTRSYLQNRLPKLGPTVNMTSNAEYKVAITLIVRNCIIGEGLLPSGACFTCNQGSYLLSIPQVPTECVICQVEKSICLGGSDIGPLPGFWRKSNETYNFLPCKEPTSCVGKDVNLPQYFPGNAVGLCAVELGYYGVLCSACLPGYKRQGTFQCLQCSPYEPYYTCGVFILLILALSWFINSTIQGAQSSNNTHSVFQKILMNHLQMLMITSSFNMNWPPEVLAVFNIAAPIEQITSSITSFDCFMDRRNPDEIDPYHFYAGEYELRIVYFKLCIMAVLPIILCAISYSVWYLILRCKGRLNELQPKFIATIVLLLFLVHPSITQSMINMFNCQDFDGDNRLVGDLQVICFKDLHFYFAWYLALPCLVIWGLGIPLIVFVMMRKDSDKLDTVAVKQKFGFLFNGYKRHNYFWEIVIMYRKILCIFIAVFLNKVGIIVQALVLLIVLVLFLQANSSNRPFAERALNDLESFSLSTQIVTIYCGIFFLSAKDPNSSSFNPNTDFALSQGGVILFFSVIIFCNISFILLWLIKFFVVVKVLIKESYPTIYIILFLCGRRDKMALETAKRARDTKKEAIIESIEAVTLMMNKMKGMYINNVFYQDHNRFLRLIYYIESEKQQIDLTEKRHNYYIQGAMARHRRFDPEIVKEANDQRPIEVVHEHIFAPQMSALASYKRNNSKSAFKMERTMLTKVQPDQEDPSAFIHFKHHESGNGIDLLEAENDSVVLMPQEKQQNKKRKRKKDQQNLQAFYLSSRNAAVGLKTNKKSHIRAEDVSALDGSKIDGELPVFLKGFKEGYASDGEELKQDPSKAYEQFHDQLHVMRKLTERMEKAKAQGSPQKVQDQFQSQKTGASGVVDDSTVIELKPFNDLESREVVVTKNTGGIGQPKIVPCEDQKRLRQEGAVRHEFLGGQIVEVDPSKQEEIDLLMITIMDEANEFVQKTGNRKFHNDNLTFTQGNSNTVRLPTIKQTQPNKDITESFRTDSSMQDYDDQREEQKVDLNYYPSTAKIDQFSSPKVELQQQPVMGEGLVQHPNFHPNLSPSLIFDESQQRVSDEDPDDSDRVMIPPNFRFGNLSEDFDRSRN